MRILNERKFNYNNEEIDELAIRELVSLGFKSKDISSSLNENSFNNITTSYNLLCNKFKFEKYSKKKEMLENISIN